MIGSLLVLQGATSVPPSLYTILLAGAAAIAASALGACIALAGAAISARQARKNLALQHRHDLQVRREERRHELYAAFLTSADSLVLATSHPSRRDQVVGKSDEMLIAAQRAKLLAPPDTFQLLNEYSSTLMNIAVDSSRSEGPQYTAAARDRRNALLAAMRADLGMERTAKQDE